MRVHEMNAVNIPNFNKNNLKHYDSIDGLRAVSCLGIILMHIEANTDYKLSGHFIFDTFIPSLTWLVSLFLMISGFGMCAGYLEKFQNSIVNLEAFYKKRYMKILPFFGFLLIIAAIMEHSMQVIYEGSVEILLLHGLLPNNEVSVLGVCWTLGVIFLFYFLFPAISVLFANQKRAWMALFFSVWIIFVCDQYFFTEYFVTESFTPRHSFIYCLPLFICGGLIFLYKENIRNICSQHRWMVMGGCVITTVFWYLSPKLCDTLSYVENMVLFAVWLSYAIGSDSKFLSCNFFRFLSNISMEMYLAQMVIFRGIEKLQLLYVFGNEGAGGWSSFILVFALTVFGLIAFIQCYKVIYKVIEENWKKSKRKNTLGEKM